VGDRGQCKVFGDGSLDHALKEYDKKFRDKSGLKWESRNEPPRSGKYAYIERNYEDGDEEEEDEAPGSIADDGEDGDADDWEPPTCTLAQPVQNLMSLIFNQQYFQATMTAMNYDANKLPLGKLGTSVIRRGFETLKDLSELFDDKDLAETKYHISYPKAVENLSNRFYTLIPHAFGRNRPPVIDGYPQLKKEIELLESLSDMKDADLIMKVRGAKKDRTHPLDRQYNGLNLKEMTVLDPKSSEFAEILDYLMNTKGDTHYMKYEIEDIFRVDRDGEAERFEASPFSGPPIDRRLLWHGSRATNFGGILSQGLRIAPPEAPATGYMFDKGIYLADMSSKSAGYCFSYNTGNTGLLLLCEAELGDPMQKLVNADYNAGSKAKAANLIATMGQGRTGPSKWKDAGAINPTLKGVMMVSNLALMFLRM
jgi:poly [ADP-ribose] polymerase 2/3/4